MDSKQLNKQKQSSSPDSRGPAKARRKVGKPAYLQRKMQVSDPGDAEEKEADAVAADVKRNAKATPGEEVTPAMTARRVVARSVESQPVPEEEETAQPKLMRQAEEVAEPLQTKLMRQAEEKEEPLQTKLWRQAAEEEEPVQTKLWREVAEEEEPLQTRLWRRTEEEQPASEPQPAAGQDDPAALLEQQIENSRGNGNPLPDTVLKYMEQQFGKDFSGVVIHNGNEAAELCQKLNARAFTIGSDVYFAPGEFTPETERGRELLAHELTHVVQQGGQQGRQVTRKIYRDPVPGSTSTGGGAGTTAATDTYSVSTGDYSGAIINNTTGNKSLRLPKIKLPALKQRNSDLFTPEVIEVLKTGRPRTNQTSNFRAAVSGSASTLLDTKISDARTHTAVENEGSSSELFFFTLTNNPRFTLFGTRENLLPRFEIPIWDPQGRSANFQVDHVKEMQLRGDDDISNYELLEGDANMGAGRAIAGQIRETIKDGLDALKEEHPTAPIPASSRWRQIKSSHQVSYSAPDWTLSHDGSEGASRFWSLANIQGGDHTELLRPMTLEERSAVGSDTTPVIYASASGGEPLANHLNPGDNWIPRVRLISWTPAEGTPGATLGTLMVDAFKASTGVSAPADYPSQPWVVNRIPSMNAGYVDPSSYTVGIRNSLRLPGMSPIELDSINLTSGGIVAEGRVLSTVPLIGDADIRISINGNEAQVYKTFSMEDLSVPAPFEVNNCDLTVFFSTARGLGIEGRADFGVDRLGEGYLAAAASTAGGFALEGGFDFDSSLFDRSSIELWYRNNQLGARGTIGIDSPDKIKGIRAANITVEYNEGAFSATGSVDPDIPGIQQAGLNMAYSEEAGLTIGGNLQLAANPAIRSGSIEVTVNKQGEEWKVSATGTAQPAIPNVDSQLTVSYDDGAFTAEFSGAYARGMLSGQVTVGATNRAIADDGTPSGDPMPDGALNIYGSGSATIQIAPWLEGTAGIRFDPNGEVTVSGEIGIPGEVEIFARREINKSIFNIAVQAPIFPGIVAEIGGGLSATAGIGPGVIDELSIGITYNPAHEEDTRVTGDAHLRVPANAGLRLGVRAGIGLGITGASVTGGLDIGGTLGIEGAAEAGVHIDWTPGTGLDITANLAVHAQPSFTFDIGGYVSVTALGFSVYDERWQFASYTFGSDYRFGISLPVHYHEGEPFDISLDDVEFEVPDIDTNQLLRGLIARIA